MRNIDAETQAIIMEQKRKLAKRLSDCINQSGMSQAELARRAGVSTGTVSFYLDPTSSNEPMQSKVHRLAIALSVSPAWLMGLNDEPCAILPKQQTVLELFDKLNHDGQCRACEYMIDLSAHPKYKKGLDEAKEAAI